MIIAGNDNTTPRRQTLYVKIYPPQVEGQPVQIYARRGLAIQGERYVANDSESDDRSPGLYRFVHSLYSKNFVEMFEGLPIVPPFPKKCSMRGFTLVELLISVAIVALLLTLVMQIVSSATSTITTSNKQIDSASLARIVLDRFDNDFSGALLNNGATALITASRTSTEIQLSHSSPVPVHEVQRRKPILGLRTRARRSSAIG